MSTRANIIITDGDDQLIFYRHSDGYPDGVKETLDEFISMVKDNVIRDNTQQAAGWLIAIGMKEYSQSIDICLSGRDKFAGWKVGAYEPTTCIHGDIEHAYLIDLARKEWNEIPIDKAEKLVKQ